MAAANNKYSAFDR